MISLKSYRNIPSTQSSDHSDNVSTAQEKIVRSSYKCKLQNQDRLHVSQIFYEENEDSICEYDEKYLQCSLNYRNPDEEQVDQSKLRRQDFSKEKRAKLKNRNNQKKLIIYLKDEEQGAFERQKCFDFYFPLSNFEYVIKQIHLNSEQKKKMEKKILEKQKQKLIEIFNKKKLTMNTVNSFCKSLKYRSSVQLLDSQKNARSSLFSQNNSNTIVISMNPSQQNQTAYSPITLQKQSKSKSNFESRTNQSLDKLDENYILDTQFQNQIQNEKKKC
ncbi:hypothetical protein ABPG72_000129 [Tetrahymena utriculariae]